MLARKLNLRVGKCLQTLLKKHLVATVFHIKYHKYIQGISHVGREKKVLVVLSYFYQLISPQISQG